MGQSTRECVRLSRACLWEASWSGFRRRQAGASTLIWGLLEPLGRELQTGWGTHGLLLPLFCEALNNPLLWASVTCPIKKGGTSLRLNRLKLCRWDPS